MERPDVLLFEIEGKANLGYSRNFGLILERNVNMPFYEMWGRRYQSVSWDGKNRIHLEVTFFYVFPFQLI